MSLFQSVKQLFGKAASAPAASPVRHHEPEPLAVPEVTAAELMTARRNGGAAALLDCREHHERRQGYIPGSAHIVMREIPSRLGELDKDTDLVVVCAHGNRSYSVADYLIQNGFRAQSLKGGIAEWQARGGEVVR